MTARAERRNHTPQPAQRYAPASTPSPRVRPRATNQRTTQARLLAPAPYHRAAPQRAEVLPPPRIKQSAPRAAKPSARVSTARSRPAPSTPQGSPSYTRKSRRRLPSRDHRAAQELAHHPHRTTKLHRTRASGKASTAQLGRAANTPPRPVPKTGTTKSRRPQRTAAHTTRASPRQDAEPSPARLGVRRALQV